MMRKICQGLMALAAVATFALSPATQVHAETYGHSDAGVGVRNEPADSQSSQSSEDVVNSSTGQPTITVQGGQLPQTAVMVKGSLSVLVAILVGSALYALYLTRDKKQHDKR